MQRLHFAAGFVLTGLIVLGLAGPISAGEQVPFSGSMDGMRVSIVPGDPPFLINTVVISGNATQLGQYELVLTSFLNPTNRTAIGDFQFVTANGDTLTAEFTGKATPTEIPGVNFVQETAVITGGTGRFAGATGGFQVERLFDTSTLLTIGSFEGTISAPGSNK